MKQACSWLAAIFVTTLLAACGGGGNSSHPASDIPNSGDQGDIPNSGDQGAASTGHVLGGSVSGLGNASGLQLTDGIDILSIDPGGSTFSFPTQLASGSAYAVAVTAQPAGKVCSVAGGTGTIDSADVANIVVTCADQAFTLGGTVQGLTRTGLVLANGADTLIVDAGTTTFTMPKQVAFGGNFAVTVVSQPVGQACTVNNGEGVMSAAGAAAIAVSCGDEFFSLGGTIAGLGNNSGLVLANGTDTLSVDAGASGFTMPAKLLYASAYSITVQSSPAGMTCTVAEGSGSMPASNVVGVAVTCAIDAYAISGAISGLTVPGLVLTNGPDALTVPVNATSFTMPTAVAFSSRYAVVVATQPTNFMCTVSNGAGTMGAGPVTDIAVTCAQTAFTLGGSISGLGSNGLILANGSDTLAVLANAATFTMPAAIAKGASYEISVVSNPAAVRCTVSNKSGVAVPGGATSNLDVSCVPATVSAWHVFQGNPGDGGDPQSGALLLDNDGSLYGTTWGGGTNDLGTVFRITPAGEQMVLWSFGGPGDGRRPTSGLIRGTDGNLYGTTANGGSRDFGTVFRLTPAGQEDVLFSFGNSGAWPLTLNQGRDGNFFGVTKLGSGGNPSAFELFRLSPAGDEVADDIYVDFGRGLPFGMTGLMEDADGTLYGAMSRGSSFGTAGNGALFREFQDGRPSPISWWDFGVAPDGASPVGSPIRANDGNIYGATANGGAYGFGTIYKLASDGSSRTTLYSFGANAGDGSHPVGTLLQANDGALYGLTSQGGSAGAGTLFRVTLDGNESIVHSFTDAPMGSLVQAGDGTIYGMATGGTTGEGMVFQLK
ncbi:choice-of-anchor tandem repeat GloVer-containing protein [Peristeroidobacter soli]|uniref:choice-of-anchor tandem repeat GloVer-containing protein n=1 Tax=Peristeroidobacter soli TaxID=2497877 RepID=UPI00101D3F6B|nr:choice-of-anchor tandem repeat GloVer-containing protein [Peristeroidobacter soli]